MKVFTSHQFNHALLQLHQLAPEHVGHQRSVLEDNRGKLSTTSPNPLRELKVCLSRKLGRQEVAYFRSCEELTPSGDEATEPFGPACRRPVSVWVYRVDDY